MRSLRLGKIGRISCLVTLICVFSFSVASADFFAASIFKITPRSASGDVAVQFISTTNPPQWDGNAKGLVVASEPGANAIIATLLTAMSLGYDVTVEMENTPNNTPQVITACSVKAP